MPPRMTGIHNYRTGSQENSTYSDKKFGFATTRLASHENDASECVWSAIKKKIFKNLKKLPFSIFNFAKEMTRRPIHYKQTRLRFIKMKSYILIIFRQRAHVYLLKCFKYVNNVCS